MNHDFQASTNIYKTFIFECLKARLKSVDLDTVRQLALQPDFDWDAFLYLAGEEFVSPLLYKILLGQKIMPLPVEEALAQEHHYFARRNLLLLHELGLTLSLLHGASIDVIVLKGAALIETMYKNIALRPMHDLDLLLRREQLPSVVELLASNGYEQTSVAQRFSYPVAMEKSGVELIVLDLHWTLFHSLYYEQQIPMGWFWKATRTITAASHPMLVLGLEAQILHLCGHLTFHHTPKHPRLLWLNDLAELIYCYKDQIDWDLILDKAQTFQLLLPLRRILIPIAQQWGAPIPAQAIQSLQTREVSAAETHAYMLSTAVKQSEGQGYWLRLNEISGWRRRLDYVLKWLFPSPASLRSRYPMSQQRLVPLAYLYHWWVGARLGIEALVTWFRNAD